MNDKKIINVEFSEIKLKYGEPIFISKLRDIFDEIEKQYPEYSNISADFYSYANDGDYDRDPPEAGIYFNGDRLETGEEYERRLTKEKQIMEMKEKQNREIEELDKKREKEHEIWEQQEYERLKKKYGI